MDKGYVMNDSAPPYPGPPMHYHPGGQQPAMYPPPPGAYHQGGPAYGPIPTTSVVVQAQAPVFTTTVVASVLQDVPGQAMCPHCQQTVITHTEHTAGLMAWLICGGLCLMGCGLCSCIPFCLESCQDVEHRCPNCQRVIYIYKRMK
uniref:LITAF domain-containing protein n=1 Tax=Neogobius melanostomus TaxID=47308 RepID=A0A8C6WN82_9GOBI